MRRSVLGWFVAWSALAGTAGAMAGAPPSVPTERPNVLVVILDDVGWEDVTSLPLVNVLGADARTYTRFYTSTFCSPTRYQLHYGGYPHEVFIGKAIDPSSDHGVPVERLSVAQALAADGYRTALFGKWHLSGTPAGGLVESARVHGFEHWRAGLPANLDPLPGEHYDWRRIDDGKQSDETTYTSIAIEAALETWWTTTAGPKYAVCAFAAPHEPFDLAPAELLGSFVPANTARGRYESALVAVDTLLGDVLTYVDTRDTYVFVLSDNGTPHQVPPPNGLYNGYKTTLYEGGIRVPMSVRGPDVVPGSDRSLVQACDLPRTIFALTGTRPRTGFSASISFAPTLAGGQGTRSHVFTQRFAPNGGLTPVLTIHHWAVVREDGWKLHFRTPGSLELYDLSNDPYEDAPLPVAAHPAGAELTALAQQVLGPFWPY